MSLYYVASLTAWGDTRDPRLSARVYRVSDTVRLGSVIAWSGSKALELPPLQSPRAWLEEALAQWKRQLP